jgi:hypothetical protein
VGKKEKEERRKKRRKRMNDEDKKLKAVAFFWYTDFSLKYMYLYMNLQQKKITNLFLKTQGVRCVYVRGRERERKGKKEIL